MTTSASPLLSKVKLQISMLDLFSNILEVCKQENKKNRIKSKFTKPRTFTEFLIPN